MARQTTTSRFKATLQRPAEAAGRDPWWFVLLPGAASGRLPRRGRTTVAGTLDGHPFVATLEPDGRHGHWLRVDEPLRRAAGVAAGEVVTVEIAPVAREPEPAVPADLRKALAAHPEARATWEATTTLARVDWIHWLDTARQAATRQRRVAAACDMLASGKRRVCCFDPSGAYSKAIAPPRPAGAPEQ